MQKTKSADRWIEGVYQIYFCWEHYYQFALIGSFVLLTYLSLTAPRNLLQRLLVYLNFTLDSEDLFGCNKQKNWFLWAMTARQAAENNRDLSESWPESPLVMKSFFGHESFVVTWMYLLLQSACLLSTLWQPLKNTSGCFCSNFFSMEKAECTKFINCEISKLLQSR